MDAEGKALLIIDMDQQNGWSSDELLKYRGSQSFESVKSVTDSLINRIAWARSKNIPVVFIICNGHNNRLAEFLESCRCGSEPVFTKGSFDAFNNRELISHLKSINARELFLAGCYTFCCIKATAEGALSAGFSVILLEDAVWEPFDNNSTKEYWLDQVKKSVRKTNVAVTSDY